MEISDKKITLEVEYDYEEFKRIYLDSLDRIPIFAGIVNNPSNILIAVTVSLIILYFFGQFSVSLLLTTLIFTSILLAVISRIAVFIFKKWFEFSAKQYHKSEDKQLTLHRKFVFKDDEIEVTFGNTIKKINWAQIVNATESDAGLFFVYNNYLVEYIPKRVFDVYEDLSRLKSFIKNRIGNRAEF